MGLLVLLLFVPMLPSSASAQVSVKLTFDLEEDRRRDGAFRFARSMATAA